MKLRQFVRATLCGAWRAMLACGESLRCVQSHEIARAKYPAPALDLHCDHRIAVNHRADADQEDNPTARFIGDEANHVKEESVAQFTAHDQDDPNPTPGGSHSGPQGRVGNSDHERVGDSDEHPGDPMHAAGENPRTPETAHAQKSAANKGTRNKCAPAGVAPTLQLSAPTLT